MAGPGLSRPHTPSCAAASGGTHPPAAGSGPRPLGPQGHGQTPPGLRNSRRRAFPLCAPGAPSSHTHGGLGPPALGGATLRPPSRSGLGSKDVPRLPLPHGRRRGDQQGPPPHPRPATLTAGTAWPVSSVAPRLASRGSCSGGNRDSGPAHHQVAPELVVDDGRQQVHQKQASFEWEKPRSSGRVWREHPRGPGPGRHPGAQRGHGHSNPPGGAARRAGTVTEQGVLVVPVRCPGHTSHPTRSLVLIQ